MESMDDNIFNESFIKAKITKALRGKPGEKGGTEASQERLPPGQSLTERWPILDLGVRPRVNLSDWKLEITGLVDRPAVWSWEDFLALPRSIVVDDMHCVTAWSRFDNAWEGVRMVDVAERVGVRPEARHVIQYGYDGYTTNVPVEDALKETAILAFKHDGAELTPEHGGPVRLIIPHLYAWKGSKFITRLEFVADDDPGFWEVRGYHNHGDPWKEERYS